MITFQFSVKDQKYLFYQLIFLFLRKKSGYLNSYFSYLSESMEN